MVKAVKKKRNYAPTLRQEQAQMTRVRILEAGRRLLAAGTYSSVTMEDIAQEAGVAYQTVYAIFSTKLRLAQAIVDAGFPHVAEALALIGPAMESDDPEVWLRTAAKVSRRINEPCADLPRFLRESGDPDLLAHYRGREEERHDGFRELITPLEKSGRLRGDLTTNEGLALLWGLTGPDWYDMLVFQRRWTPGRYEEWLGRTLIELLLDRPPRPGTRS